MARLPSETLKTIWHLLQQLSELVENATEAEFKLFETKQTIDSLEEFKEVAMEAAARYSQLANLRLRIAEIQPTISRDILRLLEQTIEQN